MPKTLYARLALGLFVVLLVTGGAYMVIVTAVTQRQMDQVSQLFNRGLAQSIVADRNLVAQGRLDETALKETFSLYMDINPSIEIYLLDLEGTILSYSAEPGQVKRQRVSLEPIRDYLSGAELPILGDDPRSHDRLKAFSVTQVPSKEAPEGYLYVVLLGEEYDSIESALQNSFVLRLGAVAGAVSLGVGLLAGLVLFFLLTRRLQRLSSVMGDFRDSGFTHYVPYGGSSRDEIDTLGGAFDDMAARIVEQLEALKEQDHLRRELVAQISHDLRTPLATLHGYLETMEMRAASLTEAARAEYLAIALGQSVRLTNMVEALFELAQLEARDTEPRHESFPLAELLHDATQKFRLPAEGAGVTLALDVTAGAMVNADVVLTERIFDNLISNALDHTPQGGTVTLSCREDADMAVIQVADTGPGIPADDLPHLFDKFYRGSNAVKNGSNAGLGLAIARHMAELQGGTLSAENGPGGGAVFTFTLPLWRNASKK